jgi:hypothetical protein
MTTSVTCCQGIERVTTTEQPAGVIPSCGKAARARRVGWTHWTNNLDPEGIVWQVTSGTDADAAQVPAHSDRIRGSSRSVQEPLAR